MDVVVRIDELPIAINLVGAIIPIEQGGQTKQAESSLFLIGSTIANPSISQYWKTATPNPIDGLYHIIKVTMGVDGEFQKEDLGPI